MMQGTGVSRGASSGGGGSSYIYVVLVIQGTDRQGFAISGNRQEGEQFSLAEEGDGATQKVRTRLYMFLTSLQVRCRKWRKWNKNQFY
jgi:hypothetical protein